MMPEIPEPKLSEGYEVVIRANAEEIEKQTLDKLENIAVREKLKIEQRQTSILIYDPKPIEPVQKPNQTLT